MAQNLEYIKEQTQIELGKLKSYNKENEFFVNQIHQEFMECEDSRVKDRDWNTKLMRQLQQDTQKIRGGLAQAESVVKDVREKITDVERRALR